MRLSGYLSQKHFDMLMELCDEDMRTREGEIAWLIVSEYNRRNIEKSLPPSETVQDVEKSSDDK